MSEHVCFICGRKGLWADEWRVYGSIMDEDDGTLFKMCSKKCRGKAAVTGIDALHDQIRVSHGLKLYGKKKTVRFAAARAAIQVAATQEKG